jgi:hypothetical protein
VSDDLRIEGGVPFQIVEVVEEEDSKFGSRYVVKALVPSESGVEERTISFVKGRVESRDRMLKQMVDYLARAGTAPIVATSASWRAACVRAAVLSARRPIGGASMARRCQRRSEPPSLS